MSSRAFPVVVLLGIAVLVALTSLFTVRETELAIRTRFGEIVGMGYGAGLHWKWPIDRVVKFEKRILTQSFQGETFLTNDNRGLIVDFYMKWRVDDAPAYFRATGGREEIAGDRLAAIVKDGIKSVVAQRTLEQIVTAERAAVTGDMFERASAAVRDLGVELIDVRVQRIDLPEDVAARVYQSMNQNFAKLASRLRAEGASAALQIRAQAERQRTEILANAEREALRIRGDADAQATAIYARAYSKFPEFYAFYRSLQAYERSLGREGDVLVVTPDGEFFKYLKSPESGGR
ncbi:MAG: protease modulator HflC [Pseudomonadota bacterium]|jgi:Membrane protease subunits, stomatin/prohibitin homologs|nr:MAG: protease modulator HflC [Pseudomonadota bacterium]